MAYRTLAIVSAGVKADRVALCGPRGTRLTATVSRCQRPCFANDHLVQSSLPQWRSSASTGQARFR